MKTTMKVLDHGYVSLVETWGSDRSIIEAARMSTNKGFLGWGPICKTCASNEVETKGPEPFCSVCEDVCEWVQGDEKLLRYLYEHKHCYDSETEVLVRGKGFVFWPNVLPGDELGCFDPETDSLVYEVPKELIRSPYRGDLYRVDHGGVDLLVTPEHRMFVKTVVRVGTNKQGWSDSWGLVKAIELGDRSMVRYRKHATRRVAPILDLSAFPPHDDPRELLRLIGFFLGDGFAGGTSKNGIYFNLRKRRKIDWLAEVCAGLGWEMSELSSVVVKSPGVGNVFRDLFYDENNEKHVPSFLLDLVSEDAEALLEGLRNSDGSEKRGAWTYSTTSSKLAHAFQLIALHAGQAVNFSEPRAMCSEKHKPLYRFSVLTRMREPVINQSKMNTSRVPYDGTIYCAHTRTGVLVVRRNGKIVLSGNSSPFEFAGAIIEVQAPIMVFREWHRHRTQSYSEMSARYTPMPNENYIPTVERLMMNSKTNKQAGVVSGAAELTEQTAEIFRLSLQSQYASQEALYQDALASGIPKELARVHLPVGRYSRMRASANLRNWLAFESLRLPANAQWEIRQYAQAVGEILKEHFPRTWGLFIEGQKV
jgi:thymidylate synthase (FAD)